MKNKYLLGGIFIGILIFGIYYFFTTYKHVYNRDERGYDLVAIVYKTSQCDCCENYISYLKANGFKVEKKEVSDEEIENLKRSLEIPQNLWSCHTTLLGNYFIEGHIPISAVEKLLTEKPEINGIALPGMPSGSPGMPGLKLEKWKIYSVKNGQNQGIFIEI